MKFSFPVLGEQTKILTHIFSRNLPTRIVTQRHSIHKLRERMAIDGMPLKIGTGWQVSRKNIWKNYMSLEKFSNHSIDKL